MAEISKVNIYPPILDTYIPAFIKDKSEESDDPECRIYFTMPQYTGTNDISKTVQITVVNTLTSQSVLDNTKTNLKLDIKFMNYEYDNSKRKNFITIFASDLIGDNFENNQFYKVQIRFISNQISVPAVPDATWLYNNRQYFSEWSKACLIRPIAKPIFVLRGFTQDSNITNETVYEIPTQSLNLIGQMTFNDETEKEILKRYRVYVKDRLNGAKVADSKIINTNSMHPNEIQYNFKYLFERESYTEPGAPMIYDLHLEYETEHGYQGQETISFRVADAGRQIPFNATIEVKPNEDNGQIDIYVDLSKIEKLGDLIIKRSSSRDEFMIWEDVHIVNEDPMGTEFKYKWSDATPESGVWYLYAIQNRIVTNKGLESQKVEYSEIIYDTEPKILILDDMFLLGDYSQLKIKFNPQVSSLQYRVADSVNETLGSKYPYVKRNGDMGYYKFSISGLISRCMDDNNIFTDEETLYGENMAYLYQDYNSQNNIGYYNDYVYEREFRKKVIEYLSNDSPKLFRSTTEGNMIVRLTEVSLTPEPALGRMIYSFNANAVEIAEPTIENCDKYNIQNVELFYEYVLKAIEYDNKHSLAKIGPSNINVDNGTLYLTKSLINRRQKEVQDAE